MSGPAGGPDRRPATLAIAGVIALGVVARLLVLRSPGFPSDVGAFVAWAEKLASLGPGRFYEPGYFSDYPPGYLYVLWLLGHLFDGEALRLAVKAASIPADVAIALLTAALVRRHAGDAAAVLAAGLWMLQPAPIFAGPYWGQVDAVGTLPYLGALLAAGGRRWTLAGVLAALATMTKPQFGLVLGIVVVAAAVEFIRAGDWRPAVRALGGAAVTLVALALPFGMTAGSFVALVRSASETYPYSSLYAFNGWSVFVDFWTPDEAWVVSGAILLAAGLLAAVVPLWWRRDTAALLAVGAAAAMAFYFLPTRAHERYLFPVLALLVPFAVTRTRLLVTYLVLAGAFFVSLYFAFTRYPQDDLVAPGWLEATLFGRIGQIAIAVVLMGAAAVVLWWLARGGARLAPPPDREDRLAPSERPAPRRWALPAGLGPGGLPTRRDYLVALLVALAVLATRGYRLDQPRDMYFDEVYHARTAFELLAQREPYEWTHPHLAKELMAVGILAFGDDRVTGAEAAPTDVAAFAVANDGTRLYATNGGEVLARARDAERPRSLGHVASAPRAIATDGERLFVVTDREIAQLSLSGGDPPASAALASPPTAVVLAGARLVVGTVGATLIFDGLDRPPVVAHVGAATLTAKPDGSELYVVDPLGTVHLVDAGSGVESKQYPSAGAVAAIAYVGGPNTLVLARAGQPLLDSIGLEDGHRETTLLSNARTGSYASGATALAVVTRTDFLYALADGRVVVADVHGMSPFAAIPTRAAMLGVDGTGDALVALGSGGAERIETGRHALAWRLPGLVAAALEAFFLVLLARRLFASPLVAAFAGVAVLADGSMFAQARIGMNDSYVGLFIVAAWYFIVAAHRPRRQAAFDLLLAGLLLGLGAASKWAAFYTLAAVLVAALAVTAQALWQGRPGRGGPLDLLRWRGANAAFLFLCFALVPAAVYVDSYAQWFGGPTMPYGWNIKELTQQMYWYHSGLTSPHPAASPWWSWPLVLKPVYWYYSQAEGGSNAYIYDAGNVALFWGALVASAWCGIAAVRARSLGLAVVLFALLAQYVAWIPISRVLFFYHFYTALPFYLLALACGLVFLWERGRQRAVTAYLVASVATFLFFYPFTSAQPIPAGQAAIYFILPTWQYDCQFYPSLVCPIAAPSDLPLAALVLRAAAAALVAAAAVAAAAAIRAPGRALALVRETLGQGARGGSAER